MRSRAVGRSCRRQQRGAVPRLGRGSLHHGCRASGRRWVSREVIRREYVNRNAQLKYWHRPGTEDKWVIFLPGSCLDHRDFDRQLGIFDSTYNLLLCDLRGQGESTMSRGHKVDFLDIVDDVLKLFELHEIASATV